MSNGFNIVAVPGGSPRGAAARIRLIFAILTVAASGLALAACQGNLSPICMAARASGADPNELVKAQCYLTADEQRAFYAQMNAIAKESQVQREAQWEANNPGRCPPRLTGPYDFRIASQERQFKERAQFSTVSDGYGRARQVYLPTSSSEAALEYIRKTMDERAAMCRANGYQPAGYVPAMFGAASAMGIPE